MKSQNVFIAHPINSDQINALKAMVKAFKVKFEIKKEPINEVVSPNKVKILNNIKQGLNEMKLIQEGKIQGTFLKDFLNEV
jgi:hypothetical protein